MGKQICQLFVKFRIFFVAQSQIRLSGVTHKSKKRRTQSALVLWQVFFETSTADGPGFSHQTFAKGLEVSLENTSPVLQRRRKSLSARVITETAVASVGIALLSCALIANQKFLDRHFVPSFFLPHHTY